MTLELEHTSQVTSILALARCNSDIPYSYRRLALSFRRYANLDASVSTAAGVIAGRIREDRLR